MLENRSQRERREVTQPSDDERRRSKENAKGERVRRQRAERQRPPSLARETPGERQRRNRQRESAGHHRQSSRHIIKNIVRAQSCEVLPIVGERRSIGVNDLRK